MKIKVIASGSKGNCTYVECGETRLLIDMGVNYKTVQNALQQDDHILFCTEDHNQLTAIQGVLITHNHNDHIKGLASFVKKTHCKVYVPFGIAEQLQTIIPQENICLLDRLTQIDDVCIELIPTSHDAPHSVGYRLNYEDRSLVYITDTGYINQRYFSKLRNADIYILESNHDERMLMEGPYPYYLKQRVMSDTGHLSNHTAASYLANWIGNHTKYVVLAHLSEHNNTEALAYEETQNTLEEASKKVEIKIAKQHEPLSLLEV